MCLFQHSVRQHWHKHLAGSLLTAHIEPYHVGHMQIKEGTWFTETDENGFLRRGKATQFFDIMEYTLGRPIAFVAQVLPALHCCCY